jgi:hypothetical protein
MNEENRKRVSRKKYRKVRGSGKRREKNEEKE